MTAALIVAALGLGACGSDEPIAQPAPDGEALVVAALGDAITAGSPGYDADPQARAALGFGADERSQFEYWAERARPGLEFRNCGVFGERTDEIAARLDDCAQGADVLIVQGGSTTSPRRGRSPTPRTICTRWRAGASRSGWTPTSSTSCPGTTATRRPIDRSPSSTP